MATTPRKRHGLSVACLLVLICGGGCSYVPKPAVSRMGAMPSAEYDLHHFVFANRDSVFYLAVRGTKPLPRSLELVDERGETIARSPVLDCVNLWTLYREDLEALPMECQRDYDWGGRFAVSRQMYDSLFIEPVSWRLVVLSGQSWRVAPLQFTGCERLHNFAK